MTANDKMTVFINYDQSVMPLVHFLQTSYKPLTSHSKFLLQSLQILTRRHSHIFVRHSCILLESIEKNDKQETQLSVIKELSLLQEEIIKHKELAELGKKIKAISMQVLKEEGLEMKEEDIVVCAVQRANKIELKVRFKGYAVGVWQGQHKEAVEKHITAEDTEIHDEAIIQKFRQDYQEAQIDALQAPYKLLRVQNAYFQNVFLQTDQLIQYKHFSGQAKWLDKYPVKFTFEEVIDGKAYATIPYYSNVGCITHFRGYSPKGRDIIMEDIKNGKARRCEGCKTSITKLTQDPIINKIMNCVYNPKRQPIWYFPLKNRFSCVDRENGMPVYENYYHFRDYMKEVGKHQRFPIMSKKKEQFNMTFLLGGKRMVIEDPCRGKLCQHVAFCDLRDLYATRKHLEYKCPICKLTIQESQILYLKEVVVLLRFAKCQLKKKNAFLTGLQTYFKMEVVHGDKQQDQVVNIKYRLALGDKEEVFSVPRIYKTLLDPAYPFDETQIDISDQELQNEVKQYYWPKEIDMS